MIIGFFGFNGQGKSLGMVRELLHYDVVFANFAYIGKKGQEVYTGSDTKELFDSLRLWLDKKGGISYIKKYHIRIVLAIDEAGLNFPARSWKNLSTTEAYLFAQHRKLGIDFLYTAQNSIMVDRILRYNTAIGIWMIKFFCIFFERFYQGTERKKENYMYPEFFLGFPYYKHYDTYEIVESTKFYIEGKEK